MDKDSLIIQNSFICYNSFKECKYKVYDNEILFCEFLNLFVRHSKFFNFGKSKICPKLKKELLHHDFVAEFITQETQKFLEQVKIGEVVYCAIEMKDVTFLKAPKDKFNWCQYSVDGKVREARANCFRKISLGNECAEYKANKLDDLNASEILAREYGFRVKKHISKKSFSLYIYGDSQENVNHFVICLEKNRFIY